MKLTIQQITLVRNNFRHLAPVRVDALQEVYKRFAAMAPEFDGQYHTSLNDRGRTLESIIELSLLSLDHPGALFATLHNLGREYANYGSWKDTYDLISELIIDVFAEHTGDAWTLEHAHAWRTVLHFIAKGMLEGAKSRAVA